MENLFKEILMSIVVLIFGGLLVTWFIATILTIYWGIKREKDNKKTM